MTEVFSIVPVRNFKDTKIRLSSVLSVEERADLTKALLKRVVTALQNSNVTEIIIVSPIPAEIELFLQGFRKTRSVQESHRHGGVNSAMSDGVQEIPENEREKKILLMPSDLPFISSEAINRTIDLLESYDLIINPSVKRDGTNLLAFSLSKMIPLHYDDDSYSKHVKEARERRMKYLVTDWNEYSFDLDDKEDLNSLMQILEANSNENLMKILGESETLRK